MLDIRKYSIILCDLWGVVHNGEKLFDGVREFFGYCKNNNIKVVLFSNAPRKAEVVKNFLAQKIGLQPSEYHDIITSGEVFAIDIKKNIKPQARCFFIGEDKDLFMVDEIDCLHTDVIDDAELLLMTGPYNGSKDDQTIDILKALQKRNILGYCPNPDIIAQKGDKEIKCAGFVAKQYEDVGGQVVYYGKPHLKIYEHAIQTLRCRKEDMIAIGDSMVTDIQGAYNFGIDSILVLTGIIKETDGLSLKKSTIIASSLLDLIQK